MSFFSQRAPWISVRLVGSAALSLVCGGGALAGSADDSGIAAITALEHRMAGEQSVGNVLGHWDPKAVWFDVTPGDVVGLDAIKESFRVQLEHLTNIQVTILRLSVDADANIGYAFSTVHLVGNGTNGLPGIDWVIRQTDTYRHGSHGWLLTHQHISLPVNPATSTAVTNSH